jgi:transmembrane sensor
MREDPSNPDSMAATWIARRDRGFTAAEQDEFLEWLRSDPRHAAAWRKSEAAWTRLDRLQDWRPTHSGSTNADLLRMWQNRSRGPHALWAAIGVAAAILLGFVYLQPVRRDHNLGDPAQNVAVVRHEPQRRTLSDGSVVEWRPGTVFFEQFSERERRIVLKSGEAHFAVAKNRDRPFIVEAGRTSVRAVGTAFSVQHAERQVEVLVTEGKVEVHSDLSRAAGEHSPIPAPLLSAGDRLRIDPRVPASAAISRPSAMEIEKALSWQGLRLEFRDMPLRDVVEEFNRHSPVGFRLSIQDSSAAAILIGGTFRADNVEAFVRLLESSFGVAAYRHSDGTITLRRR